jgi:ribosomal protein L16 Arg81 hydroxylase
LIFPLSRQEFLSHYWGKSFLHLPGHPGKFGKLFPWSQLNRVLDYHRLSPVRLRLFKDGEAIRPRNYLQSSEGGAARVSVLSFTHYLAEGATLILDDAEDLYHPLRALAIALERVFRVRIQVNLYAGWRSNRGFDLHWDDHDAFILQVAGNKRWAVYGATRPSPLRPDIEEPAAPSGSPLWESIMREGDLMYIPRGFWHIAYPLDEPCLHLTVGLPSPTGLSLLHWLVDTLKSVTEARQDLPHLASPQEQAAYVERLGGELFKAWNSDVMGRFMEEVDAQALPRSYGQLPYAATLQGMPVDNATRIRLAAPRPVKFSEDHAQGVVQFKCCGKQWQCDQTLLPILESFNKDGRSQTFEDLVALASNGASVDSIKNFVQEMVRSGLLVVELDT